MKVSLLDIVRKLNPFDKKIKVYHNGEDNAYPQRVDGLINNSVTGKTALEIMQQYIIGKGFGIDNQFMINDEQNLIQFTKELTESLSTYRGVFIHFDANLNYELIDPKIIPFERGRVGEKDSNQYNGKILTKKNWQDSKENPVIFDVYNNNKDVIKAQIDKKGIEKYTGQVLFINLDNKYVYPLSTFHSVLNDLDSEGQSSIYKNQLLRGLHLKTIIVTPPLVGTELEEYFIDADGNRVPNKQYRIQESEREETKKTIQSFMGPEGTGRALMIEMPSWDGTSKLEDLFYVKQLDQNIDDKTFEYTEISVRENILIACKNLPIGLFKSSDNALFGQSGDAIYQMKKMYQENLTNEIELINSIINKILLNLPKYETKNPVKLIQLIDDKQIINNKGDN
jgi:hypothetical protein